MGRILRILAVACAVAVGVAACGSDTATSTEKSTGTVPAGTTVDANEASVADLEAAFTAAGVSNAKKWAHEVEEYRPYPADDPTFAKLRKSLAKYKPGEAVVDKIVSALKL